ncbi:MAG: pentapeptide repeat-containing protein [Herbinix sp.]|jgi:uncharacterized protein YjbI with pentapeptide repeats|nr:pentapeptide repeat-containing protein [Herbinix sp.]
MKIHDENAVDKELFEELKIDCSKCSGLCCTALYFSKLDGFPEDKEAGKPCVNLQSDFRCKIHAELPRRKMKGCLGYDCFGAGQKVTQTIYPHTTWSTENNPQQIFEVFLIVFQLHQILYYLAEAKTILPARNLWYDIEVLITENKSICSAPTKDILTTDINDYRKRANECLKKVSNLVKLNYSLDKKEHEKNYMGKAFKGKNFHGADFTMTLLIAAKFNGCNFNGANFLGADTRDTDFSDADLSEAVYLTQGQVNSARGNSATKLPINLTHPITWC